MSGISSGLFAEDWYEECEETRQQAAQAAIRYILQPGLAYNSHMLSL